MTLILLGVVVLALVLITSQLRTQCRINEEHDVLLRKLVCHINMLEDDEYWHHRVSMVLLRKEIHDTVLLARARGDLDVANKIMEIQNYAEQNTDASWVNGLLRGFP